MAGVEYSVAAILQVRGEAEAERKLASVGRKASEAGQGFKDLGGHLVSGIAAAGSFVSGAVDGIVRTIGAGAMAAGAAGAAAIGYGLKTGLIDVNAKLEETNIGFATLFHTLDGQSMDMALGTAKQLIGDIRKDAKDLPGEFQDFVDMAQTLTAPLVNAGKSVGDIRNMTKDTVVVAASLGIRFDQAAREMAMLIEGHAGGHNILGTRLGIGANTQVKGADWNKASTADRLDFLTKALAPAKDSLGLFAKSWAGLTSTLVDSAKQLLGTATGPLFEAMKQSMVRMLDYLGKHEDKVNSIAHLVGDKLVGYYREGEDFLERLPDYWDRTKRSLMEVRDTLKEAWTYLKPFVDKAGVVAEHVAHHPGAAMKELAALKVGGMAASALPGVLQVAAPIGQIAKGPLGDLAAKLGIGGAEAAAGGGAAAAGGLAAGGAAEGAAGAAAGAAGIGAGVAAGAALAAIAALVVAAIDNVAGAFDFFTGSLGSLWQGVTHAFGSIFQKGGLVRDALGAVGAVLFWMAGGFVDTVALAFKAVGWALDAVNMVWSGFKDAMVWLGEFLAAGLGTSLSNVNEGLKSFANWLGEIWDKIMNLPGMARAFGDEFDPGPGAAIDKSTTAASTASIVGSQMEGYVPWEVKKAMQEKTKAPHVDARGSHIMLSLNLKDSDPDRIIRRVFTQMGQTLAKPITAPYAPAPGHG